MKRILVTLALGLALPLLVSAQANWRCAFNPSICGGPTEPPDRKELCDLEVPEAFELIYGPAPIGLGCLSNPDKVSYYSNVQSYVKDSESLFVGESAELFKKFGFGPGIKFTKAWGKYKRDLIGFPTPEWDSPKPVVFGLADTYPTVYISAGQTRSIKAGACIAKVIIQVPGKYKKLNSTNCKEDITQDITGDDFQVLQWVTPTTERIY